MCGRLLPRDGNILRSSVEAVVWRGYWNLKIQKSEDKEMKKKFKLQDLDCANCAAKMEDAIKKIPGVHDASVSFMLQKMTIDAEDDQFDAVMKQVVAACAKVEPDCKILM